MRRGRLIVVVFTLFILVGGGLIVWRWLDRPKAFAGALAMTTVAGDGQRGFADGEGGKARFSDPFAVAVDDRGALYVADAGDTNRIRKIGRDGRTSTLAGAFDTPSGLAVDRQGNVYVAETGANRIRKIGRDGVVTTIAGDGTAGYRDGPATQAQFNGPIGIAVDKAGGVYVADTYNDRIRLITPDGQVKTLAGGAPGFADGKGEGAAFDTPCGLALDRDGALLIADTRNNAVRRLTKDGAVTTLARRTDEGVGAALQEPIALAVSRDGHVYIATMDRGRILELSPKAQLRVLTGRNAEAPQNRSLLMARTSGVALDRDGTLLVAETGRYAIRRLSPVHGRPPPPPEFTFAPPALLSAQAVPWPLQPQGEWHELVGGVGEVRGNRNGESRDHLHSGLDVRADVGATVVAVADEKVVSPVTTFNLNGLSEGMDIDQLVYIHMRVGRTPSGEPLDPTRFQFVRDPAGKLVAVRVKRGTRFHVGEPLGTVNAMAHVHLELGPRGGQTNPIALRFAGLADHFVPRINGVALVDATGRRLAEQQGGRAIVPRDIGAIGIVVDAWDQVDGSEARRRLGLYRVGYQILKADGTPVKGFERPLINIEFDRLPPEREAVKVTFAPDSGETVHGASETRFLYVVTNRTRGGQAQAGGWNPAELPAGDYIVRIFAADYAGNEAVEGRDLPVTLR